MIRPVTLLCMGLAAVSGLYLYQTKQQGRLLDKHIAQVHAQIDATHSRTEVLKAEYQLLNDPDRLTDLASQYLPGLKPTQPPQWSAMAELDKRLPQVSAPKPEPAADPAAPQTDQPDDDMPPAAATQPIAAAPRPAAPPVKPAPLLAQHPAPHRALIAAAPPPVSLAPPQPAAASPPAPPSAEHAPERVLARLNAAPLLPPRTGRASAQSAYTPVVVTTPRAEPPATAAEAVARIARGGAVDATVPAVASALGMARAMLANPVVVPTASAGTLYSASGSAR
jgi:hypothetical protein